MFSAIEGLPDRVIGVDISGKITSDDYRDYLIPLIEEKSQTHDRIDMLCRFDNGWSGIEPGAMWQDMRVGMSNLGRWGRVAIVTDTDWLENAVNMFKILWPGHLRHFELEDFDRASEWVRNRDRATLSCELDPDSGILSLEPSPDHSLTEDDFIMVNRVVDEYLEDHEKIQGILISSRHFPGWNGMGAMISHIRFVKEHHRLIERVAIVTDSPMGKLADHAMVHFVKAEICSFAYDSKDDALTWLGG